MAKSTADKKERNDIYTAFAVLGLFLLFGFYLYRSSGDSPEEMNVWVEQPGTPSGYQGYPYPHDDESITRMPKGEELMPLPQRELEPVENATSVVVATSAVAEPTVTTAPTELHEKPMEQVEKIIEEETAPIDPIIEAPVEVIQDLKTKIAEVELPVAPTPAPVKKAAPVVKPSPRPDKPVTKSASGIKYITSSLPCVWVVGIFKNPSNVNRVVARLRLNKFDVATGVHEKGTYVGVPCACEKNESKSALLREIFSAQPWMLRK